MVAAKSKEKGLENGAKEGPRTRARPPVEPTALLAGPICTGQAREEEKT